MGISPSWVDRCPAVLQDAITPNTARGIGSRWSDEPPKERALELGPEEERREPGEAPEASSGRTKTTLVPSGNSRSAAGTEVSRPEGFGTAQGPIRSRSDETPAGPGSHPVAPPPTGGGGRKGVERGRCAGHSWSFGCRRAPEGEGVPDPAGDQWSSWARVRGPTGRPEIGSGCSPPGRHPESGSSDGTDRRVEMGRGFGSEELTGSPGGYSGPISFFGPLLGWTFGMGVFRARTRPSPPAP